MRELSNLPFVLSLPGFRSCSACRLRGTCSAPVPGAGMALSPLLLVGEAPGATEDEQGLPFIGAAGRLLTELLEAAGCPRSLVYISNVVKCRPPGNRRPFEDEVAACSGWLLKELEVVGPRVIVALGATAYEFFGGEGVTVNRGSIKMWGEYAVIPTFHPSYLLRGYNRKFREFVVADLRHAASLAFSRGEI
ncbi:MAG: uracil-DNA glycosylase [Bacillota bacterium]